MRSFVSSCATNSSSCINRIQATTVYVTHDQMEAMAMGDRICVMDAGDIMQIDTPLRNIYSSAQ